MSQNVAQETTLHHVIHRRQWKCTIRQTHFIVVIITEITNGCLHIKQVTTEGEWDRRQRRKTHTSDGWCMQMTREDSHSHSVYSTGSRGFDFEKEKSAQLRMCACV